MNKFLGIALSLILFVSCSFSDDAAGVTTEPNDVIAEETNDLEDKASSSSIATAGAKSSSSMAMAFSSMAMAISSVAMATSSAASVIQDLTILDTLPIPVLEMLFTMQGGEVYYESDHLCEVRLYEEESGVWLKTSGAEGEWASLVLIGQGIVLEREKNVYLDGMEDCRAEFFRFKQECESRSGIFADRANEQGCGVEPEVHMTCVVPISDAGVSAEDLLVNIAERYKQKCSN